MDAIGRGVGVFVAIVLVFVFPLQYIAQTQRKSMESIVEAKTAEFTYRARRNGTITKEMYEDYIAFLGETGEFYDLTIEVAHPIWGYDLCEIEQQSMEEKQRSVQLLAAHIHTEACYDGIKHTHSNYGGNCYRYVSHTHGSGCYISVPVYHSHGTDCYINRPVYHSHSSSCYNPCGGSVRGSYSSGSSRCPTCGGNYSGTSYYYSCNRCGDSGMYCTSWSCQDCSYKDFFAFTFDNPCKQSIRDCGKSTSTIESYDRVLRCGKTTSSVEYYQQVLSCSDTGYYTRTCGKTEGAYYQGSSRVHEICDQVVTSLRATNEKQTVVKGDDIVTTMVATFLDGHTEVIEGIVTNYDKTKTGTQEVVLTYHGKVHNARTTGDLACTTKVTVLSPLTGITVLPNEQSIERYGNPNLQVMAHYRDGSSKSVSDYLMEGYDPSKLGEQEVTITYQEDTVRKVEKVKVYVTKQMLTCVTCGTNYELDENDGDHGCPYCSSLLIGIEASPQHITLRKGDPLEITVTGIYQNGRKNEITGWTSNYDKQAVGLQEVTISYDQYQDNITVRVIEKKKMCPICKNYYEIKEDGSDPGCSTCRNTAVSMEVIPNQIVVRKNQPWNLQVIVTFQDGHKEMVTDWYTDISGDRVGTYQGGIYYQALREPIQVMVTDEMEICSICHESYSVEENPDGCPVCFVTPVGIEARLRYGGDQVPFGSKIPLEVVMIYRDRHKELVFDGWTVKDYQPFSYGKQEIIVAYNGFETTITIEVVDHLARITCPKGHEYIPNEDGTDPGCPYCLTETKGTELRYFDNTYTGEVLEEVMENGFFQLNKGDYLTIILTPKDTSGLFRLQQTHSYCFGGEVIR